MGVVLHSQIARYCRAEIEQAGLEATLSPMDWHFSASASHRRFEWPVDGILAVDPPEPEALVRLLGETVLDATPRVNLGSARAVEWDGDSVRVDLAAGTRTAIDHLAGQGCRRIAYCVPEGMHLPGSGNYDAYTGAMQRAGLAPEPIIHRRWDMAAARQNVRDHIVSHGRPDGLYCHNDELAMAAFRAVRDLGLRVPEEVLIIGCEGSEFMEYFDPPLSTVSIPIQEMCRLAWNLLHERLDNPEVPPKRLLLSPQFLERELSAFKR